LAIQSGSAITCVVSLVLDILQSDGLSGHMLFLFHEASTEYCADKGVDHATIVRA